MSFQLNHTILSKCAHEVSVNVSLPSAKVRFTIFSKSRTAGVNSRVGETLSLECDTTRRTSDRIEEHAIIARHVPTIRAPVNGYSNNGAHESDCKKGDSQSFACANVNRHATTNHAANQTRQSTNPGLTATPLEYNNGVHLAKHSLGHMLELMHVLEVSSQLGTVGARPK